MQAAGRTLPFDPALAAEPGVEIVTEIRIDPDAPMLSFRTDGVLRSYWVDAHGIRALRLAAGQFAPIVELTLDEGEMRLQTVLLAPLNQRAPGHWGTGRLVRLVRFVGLDGGAAFHAALQQASGLLAEFQHDVRQHLSAISLAAYNGLGLIQAERTDQAVGKFDRILEQVGNCEETMQAHAGQLGDASSAPVVMPFIVAVHAALSLARQWMEGKANTILVVNGVLPVGAFRAPPGTIEMLLGYVLRHTAERIACASVRIVSVALDENPMGLQITIRHGGTAEEGQGAGDTLALALIERMMKQSGGEMLIPSAAERRDGFVATLWFPRHDPEHHDLYDQFAFASSLR